MWNSVSSFVLHRPGNFTSETISIIDYFLARLFSETDSPWPICSAKAGDEPMQEESNGSIMQPNYSKAKSTNLVTDGYVYPKLWVILHLLQGRQCITHVQPEHTGCFLLLMTILTKIYRVFIFFKVFVILLLLLSLLPPFCKWTEAHREQMICLKFYRHSKMMVGLKLNSCDSKFCDLP